MGHRSLKMAALAAVVGAAAPTCAPAQELSAPDATEAAAFLDRRNLVEHVGQGVLGRPLSLPNAVEFSAGTEGSEVTVQASHRLPLKNGRHYLTLTAAAPLDKKTGEGGFALDSFTADASLKIEYSWSGFAGARDFTGAAGRAFCAEHGISPENCRGGWISENRKALTDDFLRRGWSPKSHVWTFSAFAKVGHDEFKFIDAPTVAEKTETETPWSVGIAYSRAPLWKRRLYSVKFEHQRVYEDADQATVCPAPTSDPSVVCMTGALGPPKRDDKDILSLEIRQRFAGHYGVAATASYDFSNEKFGIDVPVYLISGGDYSGGVRVAYKWSGEDEDGDRDELTAAVFVSKALTLF